MSEGTRTPDTQDHDLASGLAPKDAELGVAGQTMSPGLAKMSARAGRGPVSSSPAGGGSGPGCSSGLGVVGQ